MGSACIRCYQEKSSEEILSNPIIVPETIKLSVLPAGVSFIESDYSSIPILSLPSVSIDASSSFNCRRSREVMRPADQLNFFAPIN